MRHLAGALARLAAGALFLALLVSALPPLRRLAARGGETLLAAALAGQRAEARTRLVAHHAARYGISFELAAAIERIAYEEGLDPDLAFRLVSVESGFHERAVSPVGALGLTQLMPATAAWLKPGISREDIFRRETNLRLGFRYLRSLLRVYHGDVEEALHAYNRGPGTVARIRAAGGDPANGYADQVLRRRAAPPYRGDGLLPRFPGR